MVSPILLRTGKRPAQLDPRNIRMSEVLLKSKTPLPKSYSVDKVHPGCHPKMYLNNKLGDCVMASQFELEDRFIFEEIGKASGITDAEVSKQYFKETGGSDDGLVMQDAMNWWRRYGCVAGKKVRKIGGYVEINFHNPDEVKAAIMLYRGLPAGFELPEDAMQTFVQHKPWTSTKHAPDPSEGHCMVFCGWDGNNFQVWTWGAVQTMSAAWLEEYTDECYNPFPALSKLDKKKIDVAHLQYRIDQLTGKAT